VFACETAGAAKHSQPSKLLRVVGEDDGVEVGGRGVSGQQDINVDLSVFLAISLQFHDEGIPLWIVGEVEENSSYCGDGSIDGSGGL
jgi:hypothetical protein